MARRRASDGALATAGNKTRWPQPWLLESFVREDGWLVLVEVEAGRGEITPINLIVAIHDHQEAMDAARASADVGRECARPRVGGQPWPISKVELRAPVDVKTIAKLGLGRGEIWNIHNPEMTDRISFATLS